MWQDVKGDYEVESCSITFKELDSIGTVDRILDSLVEPKKEIDIESSDAVFFKTAEILTPASFEFTSVSPIVCADNVKLTTVVEEIDAVNADTSLTNTSPSVLELIDITVPLFGPDEADIVVEAAAVVSLMSTDSDVDSDMEGSDSDMVQILTPSEMCPHGLDPCMYNYEYPVPPWLQDRQNMDALLMKQAEGVRSPRVREMAIKAAGITLDTSGKKRVMSLDELKVIQLRYPTITPFTHENATRMARVGGVNLLLGHLCVPRGCYHVSARTDWHPFCGLCNQAFSNEECIKLNDPCDYGQRQPENVAQRTRQALYDKFCKPTMKGDKIWETRYKTCPAEIVTQEEMDTHYSRLSLPEYRAWWQTDGPRYPVAGRRGGVLQLVEFVWLSREQADVPAKRQGEVINAWTDRGFSSTNQRYRCRLISHAHIFLVETKGLLYKDSDHEKRKYLRLILAQHFYHNSIGIYELVKSHQNGGPDLTSDVDTNRIAAVPRLDKDLTNQAGRRYPDYHPDFDLVNKAMPPMETITTLIAPTVRAGVSNVPATYMPRSATSVGLPRIPQPMGILIQPIVGSMLIRPPVLPGVAGLSRAPSRMTTKRTKVPLTPAQLQAAHVKEGLKRGQVPGAPPLMTPDPVTLPSTSGLVTPGILLGTDGAPLKKGELAQLAAHVSRDQRQVARDEKKVKTDPDTVVVSDNTTSGGATPEVIVVEAETQLPDTRGQRKRALGASEKDEGAPESKKKNLQQPPKPLPKKGASTVRGDDKMSSDASLAQNTRNVREVTGPLPSTSASQKGDREVATQTQPKTKGSGVSVKNWLRNLDNAATVSLDKLQPGPADPGGAESDTFVGPAFSEMRLKRLDFKGEIVSQGEESDRTLELDPPVRVKAKTAISGSIVSPKKEKKKKRVREPDSDSEVKKSKRKQELLSRRLGAQGDVASGTKTPLPSGFDVLFSTKSATPRTTSTVTSSSAAPPSVLKSAATATASTATSSAVTSSSVALPSVAKSAATVTSSTVVSSTAISSTTVSCTVTSSAVTPSTAASPIVAKDEAKTGTSPHIVKITALGPASTALLLSETVTSSARAASGTVATMSSSTSVITAKKGHYVVDVTSPRIAGRPQMTPRVDGATSGAPQAGTLVHLNSSTGYIELPQEAPPKGSAVMGEMVPITRISRESPKPSSLNEPLDQPLPNLDTLCQVAQQLWKEKAKVADPDYDFRGRSDGNRETLSQGQETKERELVDQATHEEVTTTDLPEVQDVTEAKLLETEAEAIREEARLEEEMIKNLEKEDADDRQREEDEEKRRIEEQRKAAITRKANAVTAREGREARLEAAKERRTQIEAARIKKESEIEAAKLERLRIEREVAVAAAKAEEARLEKKAKDEAKAEEVRLEKKAKDEATKEEARIKKEKDEAEAREEKAHLQQEREDAEAKEETARQQQKADDEKQKKKAAEQEQRNMEAKTAAAQKVLVTAQIPSKKEMLQVGADVTSQAQETQPDSEVQSQCGSQESSWSDRRKGGAKFQSAGKKQRDESSHRLAEQLMRGEATYVQGKLTFASQGGEELDSDEDESEPLFLVNMVPDVAHIRTAVVSDLLKQLKEANVPDCELVPTRQAKEQGRSLCSQRAVVRTDDVMVPMIPEIRAALGVRQGEATDQITTRLRHGATSVTPLTPSRKLGINAYAYDSEGGSVSLDPATMPEKRIPGMAADPMVEAGWFKVNDSDMSYVETLQKMQLHQWSAHTVLLKMMRRLKAMTIKNEHLENCVLTAMEELGADAIVTSVEAFYHVLLLRRSSLLQEVDKHLRSKATLEEVVDIMCGTDPLATTLVTE